MKLSKGLSALCAIASFCLCVDGAGMPMNLWSGARAEYTTKPTWHYESKGYFTEDKVNRLGFYGVRDIAKRHYDWLKDQRGATSFKGHCMVAAFWDPITKVVYASSIPLGPRKAEMIGASRNFGAAPSWYSQVRSIVNANVNAPAIHAEDGAYYNYETSLAAQANNGRYPAGSLIAIYGKYADWQNPGPIDPCGAGPDARDPSCMAVASALGVRYAPNAADRALLAAQQPQPQPVDQEAPPTADPQAAPADVEFDDELTDADWESALAAVEADIGQRGQQQKRHRIGNSRLQKRVPSAANPTAPAVTGWLASVDALSGSFIRTSASVVDVSMSLPAVDFDASAATSTTAVGTITTGLKSSTETSAAAPGTITPGPSKTAAGPLPSITCFQHNQDPDAGETEQGCICNSGTITETLPILATNVAYDSSCAYTELQPSSTIAITQNWGPVRTNSQICSVCTPTTDFGAKCTSMPNCFPETPSATMQIGSSPVPVGTLTSSALVSSISSAISVLCPVASTTCDQNTKVPIGGIVYIEDDSKRDDGELTVQIDSAMFQSTGDSIVRSSLIGMAAQSFAAAAVGSNCYNATYTVEQLRRRDDVLENSGNSSSLELRDHPYPVEEEILLCNAGHFASPQYYAQNWREAAKPGPQDYISVEINFKTGPGGDLICDFIKDFEKVVEAVFTPELLPEELVADNTIDIACRAAMYVAGSSGG